MKKYKLKNKKISISYPKNWEIEEDNGLISIFDPMNGVGAIQISSYLKDEKSEINKKEELREYLRKEYLDLNADEIISKIQENNNFVYFEYTINDEFWQYRLFASKDTIVFITYNCEDQDKELEKDKINDIINAIAITKPGDF